MLQPTFIRLKTIAFDRHTYIGWSVRATILILYKYNYYLDDTVYRAQHRTPGEPRYCTLLLIIWQRTTHDEITY